MQEVLAQIIWYHNIALMDKGKTAEEHIWYKYTAEEIIARNYNIDLCGYPHEEE